MKKILFGLFAVLFTFMISLVAVSDLASAETGQRAKASELCKNEGKKGQDLSKCIREKVQSFEQSAPEEGGGDEEIVVEGETTDDAS